MKVLFLDIDGVLNSAHFYKVCGDYLKTTGRDWEDDGGSAEIDPEAVKRVINICETTGCKIVVSSSWRACSLNDTKERFMQYRDLRPIIPYIVGITAYNWGPRKTRGVEISEYLNKHPEVTNYCVVDDDNDMDGHDNNFVQTYFMDGLVDDDSKKIIKILSD